MFAINSSLRQLYGNIKKKHVSLHQNNVKINFVKYHIYDYAYLIVSYRAEEEISSIAERVKFKHE